MNPAIIVLYVISWIGVVIFFTFLFTRDERNNLKSVEKSYEEAKETLYKIVEGYKELEKDYQKLTDSLIAEIKNLKGQLSNEDPSDLHSR